MTITRRAIRRLLYDEVPGLGFSGTADSVAAGSLTDTFTFQDSTQSTGHFRGMYIYRPTLTTDDRVKRIISVSAVGAASISGTNYANTADLTYEVVGILHPDELNACIIRAMKRIYFELQIPLPGDITDGDMEAVGTASWTASGVNITLTKSTGTVLSGTYSLRGVNVATNQYAQSVTIRVTPNEPIFVSAVCRADTGTGELILRDMTNGVVIGTSATSSQEQWQHLYIVAAIPGTCEEVAIRLNGQENNADIYWNHALAYRTHQTSLVAPSWLDEQHKFLKLRECRYQSAVATQRDDALSRTFDDWLQPSMFSLDPFPLETNPYMIQLKRSLPNNELWLNGKRPYSDVEPLTSSDLDTTHAPEALVLAYARQELATVLRRRYPSDKRWEVMLAESLIDVDAQTRSRPETPLQPLRREEWVGRV